MPIHIQAPDGSIAEFPDGTPDATITSVMAKTFGGPQGPAASPSQQRANADAQRRAANTPGLVRAANNGLAFNAMGTIDAAGAAAETGLHNAFSHLTGRPDSGYGMSEAFNAVRGAEAQATNAFAQAHPVQNIAANVVGAVANPINRLAGGYVGKAASLPAAIGRSAVTGAGIGAAYGAGGTQPGHNALQNAQHGAVAGAVTGAAAPVVGSLARSAGRAIGVTGRNSAPIVKALQAEKTAKYAAAENLGAAYTPEAASSLAQVMEQDTQGISPTRHPLAFSMLQDLKYRLSSGQPLSLNDLDGMRQEIYRDVANGRTADAEQHFGHQMINTIDEFINTAKNKQMAAGAASGQAAGMLGDIGINTGPPASAEDAAAAITDARAANTRFRKVQTVQNALDSGELAANRSGTGGNTNNAIRQKLSPFIDPQSRRRIPNLTADERNLLGKIVNGTPTNNALRAVGGLSPDRGTLPLLASLGAAGASHGASVPVSIVGFIARHIADQQTQQNVERLITMMAQGKAGETTNAERQLAFMASKDSGVAAVYREVRSRLTGAAPAIAASASQPNQPAGAYPN